MTAPATEVSLRLPEGWIEFDPRVPELGTEVLRAARDEWGGSPPPEVEAEIKRLLLPFIYEVKRLSASVNLVLVGLFVRVVEIEGVENPLILTANTMLALTPPNVDLEMVEAGKPAGWRVEPIDLPAGAGVVATGDTEIRDPSFAAPVPARARRYFVPIPGLNRLATLSFLTPNLDFAEDFAAVFDAVAETLSFS